MTISVPKGSVSPPYRRAAIIPVAPSDNVYQVSKRNHMVGLQDIWFAFRRHLLLIFVTIISCTALATVASLSITEIFTATSTLVLERKDVRPFETDEAKQTLDRDRSAAETEMDILRSRQFGGRIVDRLGLVRNVEFNPFAAGAPQNSSLHEIAYSLLKKLNIVAIEKPQPKKIPSPEAQRDIAISRLLAQVNISRTGESLAVNVAVANKDAELAANIANTIATLYVESSLEFKQDVRIADKERALNTGGAVAFLRERVAQPLLTTLRAEEARLLRERAELASRFGRNHPKIVDEDSQIASVRKMIDDEVQRILEDLEIEALKPSARIVSLAEIPTSPSFPKPQFIIPAAFAGSTLLAILLALIFEATDTRIRNGERTTELLQVPNFGYVPRLDSRMKDAGSRHEVTRQHYRTLADEALRAIYLSSRCSSSIKPLNIILVTACLDDPASADTAWGIATAGAVDGRKVVYADLSVRAQGQIVADQQTSVSRFLKNELSLSALISEAPKAAGKANLTNASRELGELCRLLTSKSLHDVFAGLRRLGYDFVVLHGPPVLAVADASWLAPLVDGVILTIAWGKTTEQQLTDAVSQLRLGQAPLIGTVIHEVNPRVQARHNYGGSLKYYQHSQSYMSSRA